MSKKAPPRNNKLPLQRGYLYFTDGKGDLVKASAKPKRDVTDAELLAFFRTCSGAKPFRAGAMHYVRVRATNGANAPVTDDAELNAYKQALALVEEVQRKIRSM